MSPVILLTILLVACSAQRFHFKPQTQTNWQHERDAFPNRPDTGAIQCWCTFRRSKSGRVHNETDVSCDDKIVPNEPYADNYFRPYNAEGVCELAPKPGLYPVCFYEYDIDLATTPDKARHVYGCTYSTNPIYRDMKNYYKYDLTNYHIREGELSYLYHECRRTRCKPPQKAWKPLIESDESNAVLTLASEECNWKDHIPEATEEKIVCKDNVGIDDERSSRMNQCTIMQIDPCSDYITTNITDLGNALPSVIQNCEIKQKYNFSFFGRKTEYSCHMSEDLLSKGYNQCYDTYVEIVHSGGTDNEGSSVIRCRNKGTCADPDVAQRAYRQPFLCPFD